MTVTPGETVEFSRRLRLDRLASGVVERDLVASPAERAGLARRFGVLGIDSLAGRLRVHRPAGGPLIRVEGEVVAVVRQTCVVTLKPVEGRVAESFVQLFTLAPASEDGEVFVSPEEEDTPEPLDGDALDLGEVLAEQLALALDPYPRASGARFEGVSYGRGAADGDAAAGDSPFAILKHLKNGD